MQRLDRLLQFDWLRRLAREPLLHFLLIGGLIFVVWSFIGGRSDRSLQHIEVTASDLRRLGVLAGRQWGREPTSEQLAGLLDAHVREEVLYRSALAAGLDKDDVIVRRRLVQKLDFLADGLVRMPTEDEIHDYFLTHAKQYTVAPALSFKQVYFSPDVRGQRVQVDARAALAELRNGHGTAAGDPSLIPTDLEHKTQAMLARDFGQDFARQLFALPPGRWHGPLESALGLHLVLIHRQVTGRALAFSEARDTARKDLIEQRLRDSRENAYQRMRAHYTITLPPGFKPNDPRSGESAVVR